jgi:phage repressor protein C with HTH and peptisase S24 domain
LFVKYSFSCDYWEVIEEDLMSIADRVKNRRLELGYTQVQLADAANTSQQAIQQLEHGKTKQPTYLLDLAEALKCEAQWLLTGSGMAPKPFIPNSMAIQENELGIVEDWEKSTSLFSDGIEVPFLRDIELVAVDGDFKEEDHSGLKLRFSKGTLRRVGARVDGKGVLCFPVRGNSMEPQIPEGATVAVNTEDKQIVDGKIYVINESGWKRMKILYRIGPNAVSIRSYNKDEHPDEEKSLSDVEVIGRVFWYAALI